MTRAWMPVVALALIARGAAAQTVADLPVMPCTAEGGVRSASGPATSLQFINGTAAPVEIFWLDFDGARRPYGTLAPRQQREQPTYVTHAWVVVGPSGCLGVFVAAEGPHRVLVGTTPPAGPAPIVRNDPVVAPPPVAGSSLAPPPPSLGLALFYRKYLDAGGIPIVSSGRVPDHALVAARDLVLRMLAARDDIRRRIADRGIRVAIMAQTEVTLDIPEHSDLQRVAPETNWNERARGLGATMARPAISGAEENVLCYAQDRYRGESILLHEFAHTILNIGIEVDEPAFRQRVEAAYQGAMARGLWSNTYAATNADEYWAEGVQSWFDANLEANPANGIHNFVNTREELLAHDPALARLIAEAFPHSNWRYRCT